ncbi:HIT family protein [Panacagrimonas sp.]|uniref:HIT family protein n=1 Tax=Panacagrimonas sp. TaxID=2480088 RepID=UPI003B5198AF
MKLFDRMSIFDHIIAGDLPANFVHRDDICVAFMDINPISPGHVLVVPRLSVATLAELPAEVCSHLLLLGRRIGQAQQRGLGSAAQHFLLNDGRAASQTVPHVHLHVVPRYAHDRWRTLAKMTAHIALLGRLPKMTPERLARLKAQAEAIAAAMT